MLSAANQFLLPNCVISSESVSLLIVLSAVNLFRCGIMSLAENQFLLLNCIVCSDSLFIAELCCLQQLVFSAELSCLPRIHFRCRIMLSTANQFFMPNLVTTAN